MWRRSRRPAEMKTQKTVCADTKMTKGGASLLRGNAGFTLVELLVAIVIIAVMSALLYPVFSICRESVRKAACSNNQRQIGIAFLAYCDDYKDTLPPSLIYVDNKWRPWDDLLMPYLDEARVFRCPSDRAKRRPGRLARSYSMNDQLAKTILATPGSNWPGLGTKRSKVPDQSRFVLLTELHESNGITNDLGTTNWQTMYSPPDASQYYHHHNTGSNFLFFDGHVTYYKVGMVSAEAYRFAAL